MNRDKSKNPASLSLWKRRRRDISKTEYWYSRCWKPFTRSCIGTLFYQKLNHGAGFCDLWCGVWCSNIQEEKIVCHNQEVQSEQATYIKIRPFTAKENEVLKQVAYVNDTLKYFKEIDQFLGDFVFFGNCKVQ